MTQIDVIRQLYQDGAQTVRRCADNSIYAERASLHGTAFIWYHYDNALGYIRLDNWTPIPKDYVK